MKRLLTSCLGLGFLPVAPGTWGSLPPVASFVLLSYLGASSIVTSVVMAILVLIGSFICIKCAPLVITETGKSDPQEIVADEFAGQALTFLVVLLLGCGTGFQPVFSHPTAKMAVLQNGQLWTVSGLGFVLFRLFDITKPWPIRKLEKLPNGWGVLADDLLAGVYAAISLVVILRLWNYWSTG